MNLIWAVYAACGKLEGHTVVSIYTLGLGSGTMTITVTTRCQRQQVDSASHEMQYKVAGNNSSETQQDILNTLQ